ncbi:hypothetical protein [Propionispora sp. 2/2-37]|nr:hypothetical protein [Propionispora sp. 2/2-37]
MDKYLFPWQSHIMKEYPWEMPLFMVVLAIMLSVVTWMRQKK